MLKYITLKSGLSLPIVGFCTDNLSKNTTEGIISHAFDIDYSLVDTATGYGTHAPRAKAIVQKKTHI